jgi:hypothetical protein
MFSYKIKIFSLMICMALIAASCGSSAKTESEIATAVAQTVQARDSLTNIPLLPTFTPAPAFQATLPPQPDSTDSPDQTITNPGCLPSAVLVGENPPDGTVFTPGEYFWKTWTFVNTGTCIWDKSYSLVFWDGDRMEGLVSYPLTDVVEPDGTLDISIYLQAPSTEGTATGYWRFKTPWGADFGVGSLSSSFYVQIAVSSKPKYGITNVAYELVRDPLEGCPANVTYTVYATLTSNGPVKFEYYWDQSDGNESSVKALEFTEAGSMTLHREWMIGRGDSPNPRWIQMIVTAPQYQEYDKVTILNNCP